MLFFFSVRKVCYELHGATERDRKGTTIFLNIRSKECFLFFFE